MIERGRKERPTTERNQRYYPYCKDQVEDVVHVYEMFSIKSI